MPYVFLEIFGLFWWPQRPQNDPKTTPEKGKNCKIFQFLTFSGKVCQIFEISWLRKLKTFKKETIRRQRGFLEAINQTQTEIRKKKLHKKFRFSTFLCNLCRGLDKPCWFRMMKTFNKEKDRCPGGVCEEINAVFRWKISNCNRNSHKF